MIAGILLAVSIDSWVSGLGERRDEQELRLDLESVIDGIRGGIQQNLVAQ